MKSLHTNHEKFIDQYYAQVSLLTSPLYITGPIRFVLKASGNKRVVDNIRSLKPLGPQQITDLKLLQQALYLDMKAHWDALGIDALITPNHPIPAFLDANVAKVGMLRDYQFVWAILHYPAGVMPITMSSQEGDLEYWADGHEDMWTRNIRADLASAGNMPVGVQVISRKWEDEVALGVMKAIERGLGESKETIIPEVAKKVAA